MAHRIVSMHAAYKSGNEIVDGFLSRPLTHKPTPALVLLHGYRGVNEGTGSKGGRAILSPDLPMVEKKP